MTADTCAPMPPAPITRPNGKVWRPRKPLRLSEFEDHYNETGWVVFGTHDVAVALAFLGEQLVADYGLTPDQAEATWWRSVPWSSSGHDFSYITDPDKGTPCVVFQP